MNICNKILSRCEYCCKQVFKGEMNENKTWWVLKGSKWGGSLKQSSDSGCLSCSRCVFPVCSHIRLGWVVFVSDLSRNSSRRRFCVSNDLTCHVLTYEFTQLSLMFSAHFSKIKEIIYKLQIFWSLWPCKTLS